MYFTSQIQTFYGIFIEVQLGTVQIYSKKCGLDIRHNFHPQIFVRAQIGADWHSRDGCAKGVYKDVHDLSATVHAVTRCANMRPHNLKCGGQHKYHSPTHATNCA